MPAKLHFGHLPIAPPARVVGVISSLTSVPSFLTSAERPCDLVELRLDRMNGKPTVWLPAIERLQTAGYPVLATLRLAEEGGGWARPDTDRKPVLEQVLKHAAGIDVELRSALFPAMVKHAADGKKVVVASYHDFEKTPSSKELVATLKAGALGPHVIIKLAVQINDDTDRQRLQALLMDPPVTNPCCIIGMGQAAADTRLSFPKLGSCLAYGHIDGATAPGQWSCHELQQRLRTMPASPH